MSWKFLDVLLLSALLVHTQHALRLWAKASTLDESQFLLPLPLSSSGYFDMQADSCLEAKHTLRKISNRVETTCGEEQLVGGSWSGIHIINCAVDMSFQCAL